MLARLLLVAASSAALEANRFAATPLAALRGGADEAGLATFAVESAYTSARAAATTSVARWRRDVDDGRLCPAGWSDL